MRPALLALATLVFVVTGVAMATPVPVLSVSDGRREFLGYLREGEPLVHSYRHSIYEVTVSEQLVSDGEKLRLVRVTASDIRAIEYLRWESEIRREGDSYVADAPPSELEELVIRISPGAEQRLRSGGWSFLLAEHFGEGVVRVRAERVGALVALLRGLSW